MEKGITVLRGDAAWDAANGTSFHDRVVIATYRELVEVLGEPSRHQDYDPREKVQVEWVATIGSPPGVFTVYSWKERFDVEEDQDTTIEWHLGSTNPLIEDEAVRWFRERGLYALNTSLEARTIRLRPGERW